MIGKPISEPVAAISRMPFSTDGIYSLGILPPLTSSMNDHARTALARLDAELDPSELARAARLLLVGVIHVDLLRERLAIGDLRRARDHVHLAAKATDKSLKPGLVLPAKDRLAGFGVGSHPKMRLAAGKPFERRRQPGAVGGGDRLETDFDR